MSDSGTANDTYDLIIVGAGIGGGTIAHELAGRGLSVLMLERGERLAQEPDNWSVSAVFYEKKYHSGEIWRDRQGKEFMPGIFYYVGGNSKFYGAAAVRFRDRDFDEVRHEGGIAPAWPISYDEIEPYYARAEEIMGTHGNAGEDPIEPDRKGKPFPYPHMGHEPEIERLRVKLEKRGLKPFGLPMNIDYHNGGACARCMTCDGFACKIHAKGDGETRLVNPALAKGDVTLVVGARVDRILTNEDGSRATAVEYSKGGRTYRPEARIIVCAAGAINTAALLLRSASDAHQTGLGNRSSDQLGRNYMAHNNSMMMAVSPFRRNRVQFQKTLSVNDYYYDAPGFPYPLGNVQGLGKLQGTMLSANVPFVPDWLMNAFAERSVDWWIMSEDLPDANNRVTLDTDGTIRLNYTENNMKAHSKLVRLWRRHMWALGYPITITKKMDISISLHQCGTARFGADPGTSVLDPMCRSWDVPNLFVVDASFLPSSTGFNPSLTIVAQGLRASEAILKDLETLKDLEIAKT